MEVVSACTQHHEGVPHKSHHSRIAYTCICASHEHITRAHHVRTSRALAGARAVPGRRALLVHGRAGHPRRGRGALLPRLHRRRVRCPLSLSTPQTTHTFPLCHAVRLSTAHLVPPQPVSFTTADPHTESSQSHSRHPPHIAHPHSLSRPRAQARLPARAAHPLPRPQAGECRPPRERCPRRDVAHPNTLRPQKSRGRFVPHLLFFASSKATPVCSLARRGAF